MNQREQFHHRHLDSRVEFAALELPGRRTTSFQIRLFAGLVDEPDEQLGLAHLVEQTLAKGTEHHSAQQFSDAFDSIGAQRGSAVGRESLVFRCNCLPEYAEEALSLHAEMLRTPTFPQEFCDVARDLSLQELTALEDDPGELSQKFIAPHAYGRRLGRHELGTKECLARITRDDMTAYWQKHFAAGKIQLTVSGAVNVDRFARSVDELFSHFGNGDAHRGDPAAIDFSPGLRHHQKDLEQQHVLICWPGVKITDEQYPVQRLVLSLLGGGMSSRLFTEVREKQGLVYWVGAWGEYPRSGGMIFLGASTMPDRCDQTIKTLLREVDRLAEDVTEEELDRAKVGIIAKTDTHGDLTRARLNELGRDLFYYGRPVSISEKNEKVMAVTVENIRHYLTNQPRDRRCLLTLGPRPIEDAS